MTYTPDDFESYENYKIYYGIVTDLFASLTGASGLAKETTLTTVKDRLIASGYSVAEQVDLLRTSVLIGSNPNLINAPQDISGQTEINASSTSVTGDMTLYTVTASKVFYLKFLSVGLVVTLSGDVLIRDGNGGTIIDAFKAQSSSTLNIMRSYSMSKKISTSVYIDFVTTTASSGLAVVSGYEK